MRVVVPSLGYGDFLADTLPAWRAFLPPSARLTVVTAPGDAETQAVAAGVAGVDVCVSDVWTAGGRVLNKGGALDLAFGFVPGYTAPPSVRETCLALDADVVPFGRFPNRRDLRTGVLYGCPRYHCPTPADLDRHREGGPRRLPIGLRVIRQRQGGGEPALADPVDAARAAQACLGYFQLFRYRPGLAFGASRTAGKYDIDFRQHFHARRAVEGLYVLHLGALSRANWKGRVLPRWRGQP